MIALLGATVASLGQPSSLITDIFASCSCVSPLLSTCPPAPPAHPTSLSSPSRGIVIYTLFATQEDVLATHHALLFPAHFRRSQQTQSQLRSRSGSNPKLSNLQPQRIHPLNSRPRYGGLRSRLREGRRRNPASSPRVALLAEAGWRRRSVWRKRC